MAVRSAGILLYRRTAAGLEVFVAHMGGPFWAKKDAGAWSIAKGLIEPGETADATARREFAEETGAAPPAGPLLPLGSVRQPGGKIVIGFAAEGDFDPASLASNSFEMEWPPRSGRRQSFPEIDRAGWFGLDAARVKMLKGQLPLLEALAAHLGGAGR